MPADEFVPMLAGLLSLVRDERPSPEKQISEIRRRRLLALMVAWLSHKARKRPLLLIVENIHWADPSTLEWLHELAKIADALRLMLVVTYRPEFVPPWYNLVRTMGLQLDRLAVSELEQMLDALTPEHTLDPKTRRLLIQRCDGVPLFLEELVKTLSEESSEIFEPGVPISLRDMLAARLDRLGAFKEIARSASVIGRQFSYNLLRMLLDARPRDLERGLELLVDADIIRPIGSGLNATFAFKHALLQDAAYSSLLRSERRTYHRKLANAYRKHYAWLTEIEPEIVARHASAGGLYGDALNYWWSAGSRARARSAYNEALGHFRRGLADAELTSEFGDTNPAAGTEQLIRFCAAIAATAIAAEGFAAPEVERMSRRALELISNETETETTTAALGGLISYYQVRGPLHEAQKLCERQLKLADGNADSPQAVGAQRRMGWCQFCRGEVGLGQQRLHAAVLQYQSLSVSDSGRLAETDTGVVGLVNLGWAECFVGNTDSAIRWCAESLTRARTLGGLAMDLAYALSMSAAAAQQRGDVAEAFDLASGALDLATRNELPYWQAWATVLRGWAMSHDNLEHGLAQIKLGIAAYRSTGARLFVPHSLALAAETCLRLGAAEDGLSLVREGLAIAAEIDVHFVDVELLRLRGLFEWQQRSPVVAMTTLQEAIVLAERQGALGVRERVERDIEDLR